MCLGVIIALKHEINILSGALTPTMESIKLKGYIYIERESNRE